MAETALHPRLEKLDMDQARNLVHSDIANSAKNGPMAVHDVLHTVAFQGQTVGAPLMCNPAVADTLQVRPAPRGIPRASRTNWTRLVPPPVLIGHVSSLLPRDPPRLLSPRAPPAIRLRGPTPRAARRQGDTIQKFYAETVDPTKIIVAAVGVDHAKLVADAEEAFGGLKAQSKIATPQAAHYVGGDLRMPGEAGQVHIAVGFNGPRPHPRVPLHARHAPPPPPPPPPRSR
jgi:predicted Zn-dependent peptidase